MLSQAFTLFAVALTVAPAALAQSISCYTTGNNAASSCASFVDEFCMTINGVSVRQNEAVSRCFMVNNHRCDFTAFNTGATTRLSADNCRTVANNAIKQCPMGGKGKYAANLPFTFTVDPNNGACTSDILPGS